VLLDGSDRVLLYRFRRTDPSATGGFGWATPGGGVEPGESLAQAAAREMFEETGLRVTAAELGRPVAVTGGAADLGWADGLFEDVYFSHRVTGLVIDSSGLRDGVERDTFDGFRWWTVAELAATAETIYPFGLVELLNDLIAGRFPTEPVRLPWHH
jgi:8-oxo-dGTP pyrophosphatase MutT (NUDIX family)